MVKHFKVEGPYGAGDLDLLFPHDPPDINASVQDLLEDRLSNGWALHFAAEDHNGNWRFLFVANGQIT